MNKLSIKQKYCYKCGETKPITEFNKHKSRSDGLQSICRSCQSISNKLRYTKSKPKVSPSKDLFKSSSITKKSSITNSEINNTTATRISHYLANLKSIEDIDKEIMETEVKLSVMKYLKLKNFK